MIQLKNTILYKIKKIFRKTKDRNAVPEYTPSPDFLVQNRSSNVNYIPPIIWTFWDGPMPSLVKICLEKLKEVNTEFEVRVLNMDSYHQFVHQDLEKNDYGKKAYFSDHLRLLLLKEYGGIWVDASVLTTRNLKWVLDKSLEHNVDFVADFNSSLMKPGGVPMIENFFIGCSKNNALIKDVLIEWEKWFYSNDKSCYFKKMDNYDILKQGLNNHLQNYLFMHLCFQKLLVQNNNYNYLLFDTSQNCLFYYYKATGTEIDLWLAENLLLKHSPIILSPIIKFTSYERSRISSFIDYKCYIRKSILGKYCH